MFKKPSWFYTDVLLNMFSENHGEAIKEYKKIIQQDDSDEIHDFFSKKNLPAILGSTDFVAWVKVKYYLQKNHDEVPQAKDLAPSIVAIKKEVSLCYKLGIMALEVTKRGQENEPRNVAVFLSRKHTGLSLEEIGKEFGSIKYSTVSNVARRVDSQLANNKDLYKMVAKIRQRLNF